MRLMLTSKESVVVRGEAVRAGVLARLAAAVVGGAPRRSRCPALPGLIAITLLGSIPECVAAAASVLIGAGDIASCGSNGDEATAAILARHAGIVFTTGDNVYPDGSSSDFARCYAPSWGAFRGRTRPAPGNHDYHTAGAAGYFAYFGLRAGNPQRGYYAYNLGTWRVYVLNSNCSEVGGCELGSPQERWLRADLARYPRRCSLAYWHHPLFSSARHGSQPHGLAFWRALYAAGAEIVINGHDHVYERFAPQTPGGILNTARGIREFVVGTGGKSHYDFPRIRANSRVRDNTTFGVLKLVLGDGVYSWRFIPEAGKTFTDSGRGLCH